MPSPDHETMPMLRAGVLSGSPSRFPVPFLATPQQRSMQRSMIPYGGNPATLQYDQLLQVDFAVLE